MIQRVRKVEHGFIVAISDDEARELGLIDGQFVNVQVAAPEEIAALPAEWQQALDEHWPWLEPGLVYLSGR